MNIAERKAAAEARYNELQEQNRVNQEEMTKLQGEYRLLSELEAEEQSYKPSKPNKKANVIEAVAEEAK